MRQAPAPHASTAQGAASPTYPQTRKAALVAVAAMLWMLLTTPVRMLRHLARKVGGMEAETFADAQGGFVDTHKLLLGLAAIVIAIFGPIIGAQLLASLLPDYFASVATIFSAFTNADVNSTLGNTILHSMAILVLLAAIFAPIGLAVAVFAVKRYGARSS